MKPLHHEVVVGYERVGHWQSRSDGPSVRGGKNNFIYRLL
jgi:hypothetical protein